MKELEMILAAVAQLGEAGKEAFIWWLVMDKGLHYIAVIGCFSIVALAVVYLTRLSSDGGRLLLLSKRMGFDFRFNVNSTEFEQMLEWVSLKNDKP